MPRRTEYDIARGKRLTHIREVLGLTQDAMVDRLNETALSLGLPARYKYYTVSRMESGAITFEDAAVWLALDPTRHGWDWFVLGTEPERVRPRIPAVADAEVETEIRPRRHAKARPSGAHRRQA
jgi:transcriptional regulator with XRE-family HTH domain